MNPLWHPSQTSHNCLIRHKKQIPCKKGLDHPSLQVLHRRKDSSILHVIHKPFNPGFEKPRWQVRQMAKYCLRKHEKHLVLYLEKPILQSEHKSQKVMSLQEKQSNPRKKLIQFDSKIRRDR